MVKKLPAMQETLVWSLGQEDPLEKEMATHSRTLAWKIPWTEEPGRLVDYIPWGLKESDKWYILFIGYFKHFMTGVAYTSKDCHCCLVAKSCLTFCYPMDCISQASLSSTISPSLLKLMSIESVIPSNHLILCHPLLLLPSIFPNISVFSSELAFHINWLKYWSFSFSISPSSEYSGLISFRINWFDLLAIQGILKSLL